MIAYYLKIMMVDILGYLLFKNYVGKYSLKYVSPANISHSLRFFPDVSMSYTYNDTDIPRERLFEDFGRFYLDACSLQNYLIPLEQISNYNRIDSTFRFGLAPELSGEFHWYLGNAREGYVIDGMCDYVALIKRYENLKKIFSEIVRTGRLLSRRELNILNFREKGGINVLERADGTFVWAGGGLHRLTMSKVASLSTIPVCVLLRDRSLLRDRRLTKFARHTVPAFDTVIAKLF